jgi:hypothetical protein
VSISRKARECVDHCTGTSRTAGPCQQRFWRSLRSEKETVVAVDGSLCSRQYSLPQSMHLRMHFTLHSSHVRLQTMQSWCTPYKMSDLRYSDARLRHDASIYAGLFRCLWDAYKLFLIPTCHRPRATSRQQGRTRHKD